MRQNAPNSGQDDLDLPLFSEDMLDRPSPLLVACLRRSNDSLDLERALSSVAAEYAPMLRVCVSDAIADQRFRTRYRIMGTPTYLILENGVERERLLGKADEPTLRKFINESFGLD